MPTAPPLPFYFDWTFWAVFLSLVAVVLSQLPPVRLLLRPKRLEVEVHSRILVSHTVGNPNAGMVLSVRNTGGRTLRVKSLTLRITRDGSQLTKLQGLNYFETASATAPILFVPYALNAGDTWTHSVVFFNDFDRLTEKYFRESQSALTADIRKRLAARPENDKSAVEADPKLVEPFYELYRRLFIWLPGEYVVALEVTTEPGSASFSKSYRFTLYESDTQDLEQATADYKFGAGISFSTASPARVNLPLTEHIG